MKSTQFFSKIFLVFCFIFSSCQLDDGPFESHQNQESIPESFSEYFGNEISRDFLGKVIDKNHNPIEGVSISIGNATALTDNNGVFIIKDANVFERFGYIKAEKAGYIHGSRSVVPTNGTNKVTIMLLNEAITGYVSSGSASTVTAPDGSEVSFDGNFVKEDGTAYSGLVNVIMHHLDPTDDDVELQMPGMLYAQNEDGAERMLQTLGMLAVELRGSGGEDLNLAAGSTSEIKIPVDASLLSMAPAAIPLWYFDEILGVWKEEGEAILQGNMYVGTVTHFSFWNCDIPAEAITLCVNVSNEDGEAISNIAVVITSTSFGSRSGYTNEIGEVCGLVPSGETLELKINTYSFCDNSLLSQIIGPFMTDSEISIVVPDSPNAIQETVIGSFNTCDGDSIINGYLEFTHGSRTFINTVNDGSFEFNLLRCAEDNTFSIIGGDYINLQVTDILNYTFTTPVTDIGMISACNAATEFIQYTIDDEETVTIIGIFGGFYDPSVNGPQNSTVPRLDITSWKFNNSTGTCFFMVCILNEDNPLGTYQYAGTSSDNTGFYIDDGDTFGCPDVFSISTNNNNIIYNLNTFGEVGEYIDVSFSGEYEDFDGNPHTITGAVHILRDQ
jgi:hypothetical protein